MLRARTMIWQRIATFLIHAPMMLLLLPTRTPAQEILEPGTQLLKVAEGCKFTEGPVVDAEGNLYFSDGANDRIMLLDADRKLSVFRQPCGRVNGMTMDHEGRLVVCQSSGDGGKRRVARFERDGQETVLADEYQERPFIAPNDLCIDGQERIFFTDPYYGPPAEKSQPQSGVYRIDPDGTVTLVVENLERPNGIVLTADGQAIYISDRGTQHLHRYKVLHDGSLQHEKVVHDFSPDRGIDGMRLDDEGNIYGAAGEGPTTGLFVISPEGKRLHHEVLPEFTTNVAFGGQDRRDLYLTATSGVYLLRTRRAGADVPIPSSKE